MTDRPNALTLPSKRVFILGPAHHIYLTGCALSKFKTYDTPLGELTLDLDSMSVVATQGTIYSFVLFLHGIFPGLT
jgi:AmmeMemoRadiSam system protein B